MTRYILALDPSGNFNEGKGVTGWCLYDTETNKIAKFGAIKAAKYDTMMDYWKAHIQLLDSLVGFTYTLVLEDYMLYANRATSQINSRFETPKLIGVLQFEAYQRGTDVIFQTASAVKNRWNPEVLLYKKLIEERNGCYYIAEIKLSNHTLDAIKHAIHYATFRKGD